MFQGKKLIAIVSSLIILTEVLSFVTYLYPVVNPWVFASVALVAWGVTLYKLEWGVCIVFAELAIGSLGKLFVLPMNGGQLSIRIVLWLIIMSIWLAQVVRTRRISFLQSQFFKPYFILAAVLIWGTVWGLVRGHGFGSVFFDVNNYLYFLLIFPVYEVLSRRDKTRLVSNISTVIASALTWLSIKTIALFYIFSHEFFGLQDIIYAWSRKLQLAEITNINPTELLSRIFIQSQIWILFGFFVALGYVFHCYSGAKPSGVIESKNEFYRLSASRMTLILSVLFSAALIMSFSRSFWLAGILSLAVFLILLLFKRESFKRVFYFGILSTIVIVLGIALTLGTAAFPLPPGTSSSDFLKDRASQFTEAAASSRVAQIKPLFMTIISHPIIGSGFGTTVTYQSQDPRVLKNHPDGWYATSSFELGWLEVWLKIGLFGMLVYLYLLWKIFKAGWNITHHPERSLSEVEGYMSRYIILAALAGLLSLIFTHGLSPYLNHPLGIGIILLLTSLFDIKYKQHNI